MARRLIALLLVAGTAAAACAYTPTEVTPEIPANARSSVVLAADGSTLATLHGEQDRIEVPLQTMPQRLRDAVLAIEDHRFYEHPGVDIRAILRATRANAAAGEIEQGGSTITQQLVKLTLLNSGQTLSRKIQEASLAFELERHYPKDRILEIYLNTIYLGNGAYGVEAAAQHYFAKHVEALTLPEAALLAGLIQAPSEDDPRRFPDRALARRNEVLDRMAELGWIGPDEGAAARTSPVAVAPVPVDERYPAAHFVEEVKQQILGDPRFGTTREEREVLLFEGGLRIHTTLDPRLQAAAEAAVGEVLTDPVGDPEAALVAIEPASGHVVAMVGGRDYFGSAASAKCNLATGCQEPPGRGTGSAFKPVVLAAALEQNIPLSEQLPAPGCITLDIGAAEPWAPCNADPGEGAPAGVDLVEGTVHSFNTLYAQLILQVGPDRAVDMAHRLGVTSPLEAVPAAVLGSNNVMPVDMASVYATFANRGVHVQPVLVTEITTVDGSVLFRASHRQDKAIRPEIADTVNHVLRQVIERGTGTSARLDRPAAGKTGTGEDYRNAWFCGYTPHLSTAVWVGFPEGEVPMHPPNTRITVYGGTWPAQIWQRFMGTALAGRPAADFRPPPTTVPPTTTTVPGAPLPEAAPGALLPNGAVQVPNVIGLSAGDAEQRLEAVGLATRIRTVPDHTLPAGQVRSQSPPPGTAVAPRTVVTVDVASGPPTNEGGRSTVPDVIGLPEQQARQVLADAGYQTDAIAAAAPIGVGAEERPGHVWRQRPAAGSYEERGTAVTVYVNP